MQNIKEASRTQNLQESAGRINYAPSAQTQILDPTSQRKVKPRIEIRLGRSRLMETQWLYTQYGHKTPSWLRGTFLLNQHRRKHLNDNLREAQLDRVFCGKCCSSEDWASLLHSVWHDINEVPSCN